MKLQSAIAASLLPLFLLFVPTVRADSDEQMLMETLAREAVSADTSKAAQAIGKLRSLGPAGLNALFTVHAKAIGEQISNPLFPATADGSRKWRSS